MFNRDDYDPYEDERRDEEYRRRREREHQAWACAGPGSFWYDSADPYDEDEEEDEEEL
jgi:hypothetical protein